MSIVTVTDARDERLRDYTSLTDVHLRKTLEAAHGLYLAESEKVLARALRAGHHPRSVLTLPAKAERVQHLLTACSIQGADHSDTPVYVLPREELAGLTGFDMHRGVMASMHRPALPALGAVLQNARRVVILDGLSDHSNVGLAFRSAAALGADAVLLTPSCADAWYRRAVRLSMGAVFAVPWTRLPAWPEAGPLLRDLGFHLVAFALDDRALTLQTFVADLPKRCAFIFGNEGEGLGRQALGAADTLVRIPMDRGVDSLNVATSAAVALWAARAADGGEA